MNKKLEKAFIDYGLTVSGKNELYGTVKGYEVSVCVKTFDPISPLRIHIACYATPEQRVAIENALSNRSDIIGQKKVTDLGVALNLNEWTAGSMVRRLPEILDWTLGMLNANGALGAGYCPHCGKLLKADAAVKCDVDGASVTLDAECQGAVNAVIDKQNADYKNAPNRYFRGFLGALIGGVAGGLLVALFFIIGFASSVSGFVAVALGAFLYGKFGGKPNKAMVVIVTLTSLACLVASVFITYIVAAGMAARDQGFYNISAFDAFTAYMEIDEISRSFYADLATVILFALVGMGFYIWVLLRSIKNKGKKSRVVESGSQNTDRQTSVVPNGDDVFPKHAQSPSNDVFPEYAADDGAAVQAEAQRSDNTDSK